MQNSMEVYFLINLAVDTALLAVVARANECFRLRRILLCGLLAASYAVLVRSLSARLAHPAVQILLLLILGMLLCGDPGALRWGSVSFQLFCGAMMLGGFGALFPGSGRGLTAAIGAGLLLIHLLLRVRRQRFISWEVTVLIALRGRTVHFRALIDTGNRLREPISGLPVLIAESSLLDGLFSDGVRADQLSCRRVAFGALNGSGTVRCFHPDTVLIRRGDRLLRAPEVWVAIYPGKIPGVSRALAPPSFAIIPGTSQVQIQSK